MEINLNFQQGFEKGGQSMYSSYETVNRNELSPLQMQGIALKSYISNVYGNFVSSPGIINKWVDMMIKIEGFRYMNHRFTGASLILIDQYLKYVKQEDFVDVLRTIFRDDEIMKPFLENLIERGHQREGIVYLTKKILFNYIFKIYFFKFSSSGSLTESSVEDSRLEEDSSDINFPSITGSVA